MSLELETRALGRGPFRIGDWLVEPSLNRLSKDDATIQLELKVMDVLVCLAERAGEVVTRQEIVDRVWATEFISDNTLTHAVTELRNALGDDARNPSFIETIHRRGYRLIAPVDVAVSDEVGESKVARFPVRERPETATDDRSPYPGLAAFTEEDAEFFFGREDEVAKMWRKLTSRRLLAVIGPSGVGKSSFLRAGVIPAKPEGWGFLVCQPGEAPFASLARVLVPEFAGDIDATAQLVDIRDGDRAVAMVSRWRDRHGQGLFIVDQFEELFTLNSPVDQARFAETLRRLVDDCDVHILLSLRDDFLYRCQSYEPLRPVFDSLTPLEQPAAEALRRALAEPAKRLGFVFEDDHLATDMAAEVEGARGALPLLAFAMARLWETRDRDRRLMTRQAYQDIGGVGGALGQHAEATLKAVGDDRLPIVREIFRNLVTAEGTRAVREWNELLSVFPDSQRIDAETVLGRLVDARLLTSFEEEDVEGDGRRRIEVVHESLLTSWPRLVRWQTQDADAAQLRDQLRQAARTWDEQGRSDDTLWTGSAYREFALWRERYPGGLTEVEEAFAGAMTHHARWRKRRRRIVAVSAFTLTVLLAVVLGTLWRRSVLETRRAEASKLLALAEVQLDKDPTEALAFATASLELTDTKAARVFAVRALWQAPPALVVSDNRNCRFPQFSPDGRWLASAAHSDEILVWEESGGAPLRLPGHTISPKETNFALWTRSGFLVTYHGTDEHVRVWSIPEGEVVRSIEVGEGARCQVGDDHLFAELPETDPENGHRLVRLRSWQLPNGEPKDLGRVDWTALGARVIHRDPRGDGLINATRGLFDPTGRGWIYATGDTIFYRRLPIQRNVPDVILGRHENHAGVLLDRTGDRIWSRDRSTGEWRSWSLSTTNPRLLDVIPPPPDPDEFRYAVRDRNGRWWRSGWGADKAPLLWDLAGLPGARPLRLNRNKSWYMSFMDIHPDGDWLVSSVDSWSQLMFSPLVKPYPSVVEGYVSPFHPVEFSPNGDWLASAWAGVSLRIWPLQVNGRRQPLTTKRGELLCAVAFDTGGERLLTTGYGNYLSIVPLDGGSLKRLEGFSNEHLVFGAAFSPSGRRVAAATVYGTAEKKVLRLWDLETGGVQIFNLEGARTESKGISDHQANETGWENGVYDLLFADESTLYTAGWGGVRKWDLETGEFEVIVSMESNGLMQMDMSADRAKMVTTVRRDEAAARYTGVVVHDLAAGTSRALETFGDASVCLAIDPNGKVLATGSPDGFVRVGRIDGGEPHLLIGHDGEVDDVAISPDLEWIASGGEDETLRLWPMPDLSKPPLHTLPYKKLIAKLKTLTNLRVVRDEESSTGWKIEVGPFPGWETVPEW